ncbi:MAG: MarR family transcriptional regulator [Patescibacteria group bacterium]|nr:MarR family transcriptional regulator [Patescibacteria group bacterium]
MPTKKTFEKLISTMFTMRRNFLDRLECAGGVGDRITVLHLEVLQLVAELPGLPMRHVAQHFFITPPSATSLVDAMVKDGYIKRVVDSTDRRLVRLQITPSGRRHLKLGQKAMETKMHDLLGSLSDQDAQQLIRIVGKVVTALKEREREKTLSY